MADNDLAANPKQILARQAHKHRQNTALIHFTQKLGTLFQLQMLQEVKFLKTIMK